jgi:hypothetical protein
MRAKLSLAALAVFCAAILAATWRYPGGDFIVQKTDGFSLRNFWCDLLREPAYNGAANGASVWLATLAFAAIGVALAPFWLEVSRLVPARERLLRVAGMISAVATVLVALLPSDRFPQLHGPVVITAGGLGIICGFFVGRAALAERRRWPLFAASSAALLLFAVANLLLYVWAVYFNGPKLVLLPAVQKLATLSLVVWMVAGLAAASARHPKP